jgi:uncharacterized protein (TIGR00725 family)
MNKKIAVFGSGKETLDAHVYQTAEALGQEIAKQGFVLLTGAAKGVSFYAAKGAKTQGGMSVGINPAFDEVDVKNYNVSNDYLDVVIYTGMGYKGRNVITVRSCDGMIAVNGGFGTLNEISIAEGEIKPIVVIEGTGGSADITREIFAQLNPDYPYFATATNVIDAVAKLKKMMADKDAKAISGNRTSQ